MEEATEEQRAIALYQAVGCDSKALPDPTIDADNTSDTARGLVVVMLSWTLARRYIPRWLQLTCFAMVAQNVNACRYDGPKAEETWDDGAVIPYQRRQLLKTAWVTAENFPGRVWQEMWSRLPKVVQQEFLENLYLLPADNLMGHATLKERLLLCWRKRDPFYDFLKILHAPYPSRSKALEQLPYLMEKMALQMQVDDVFLRDSGTDGRDMQVRVVGWVVVAASCGFVLFRSWLT